MKYIKKFKESVYPSPDKDDYYVEIKYVDHRDLNMNDKIRMSKYNFDWIVSLFKLTDVRQPDSYKSPYEKYNTILYTNSIYAIYISELEDEYFLVSFSRLDGHYQIFYKCDQLDGVKELLKDSKII